MARLLIRLKDNYRAGDPNSSEAVAYRRGDIVDILPEGANWGEKTTAVNGFLRLELLGVDNAQVERFIQPDLIQSGTEEDGSPIMAFRRRRSFRFLFDSVPQQVRDLVSQRDDGGAIDRHTAHLAVGLTGDYTWAQVRQYVHNKVTNLTEEDEGTIL